MSECKEKLINTDFIKKIYIDEGKENYSVIVTSSPDDRNTICMSETIIKSYSYNENNKRAVKEEVKEYLRNLTNLINNKMYKV